MMKKADIDFFTSIPLFTKLTEEQIGTIAPRLVASIQSPGTTLFKQGDEAQSLFIIRTGIIEIFRADPPSEKSDNLLCQLSAGDVFGEFSLLAHGHRLTTAVVKDSSELYELTKVDFEAVVENDPWLGVHVLKAIAQRMITPFQLHPDRFFMALKE